MKKNLIAVSVLCFTMFFSSCASIVSDTTYPVAINSTPGGAKITIVNKKGEQVYTGNTPSSVKLKASNSYMTGERYTVTLSMAGYEDQVVYLDSKIDGWYWGNILIGGLLGMLIIDPVTGAMYRLDAKTVDVSLKKGGSDVALQVVDVKTLPEGVKKYLVKLN